MLERPNKAPMSARQASLCTIVDPATREPLDRGLALFFEDGRSFTGESVLELHVHGSPAVVSAVLDALARTEGLRPADAGEFTERAFANGKMDLTEVEGLSDLIHAETEEQRRQALRQASGELSAMYEGWRDAVVRALAHAEAVIEFGDDEDDVGDEVFEALGPRVHELLTAISSHLADHRRGELVRDGVRVALVGPPNAGKSSMLNWLARRPAAIVSATAGTTRDAIEVPLNLAGYAVRVVDTAGLRETADEVEAEGVRRALAAVEEADLYFAVVDAAEAAAAGELPPLARRVAPGAAAVVLNKVDAFSEAEREAMVAAVAGLARQAGAAPDRVLAASCTEGRGMDTVLESLTGHVRARVGAGSSGQPSLTRQRHRDLLRKCADALQRFLDRPPETDLAAEELRLAAHALGEITGRVHVEELLDVIFRDFCIGK